MPDEGEWPKPKNGSDAEEKPFEKSRKLSITRTPYRPQQNTKLMNENKTSWSSELLDVFQDHIYNEAQLECNESYLYSEINTNHNIPHRNFAIQNTITSTTIITESNPHYNPRPIIPLSTPHYQKTCTENKNQSNGQECSVCYEVGLVIEMPCNRGHRFCQDCLSELFKRATTDHSLLPVRCCGFEVDYKLAYAVLDSSSLLKFQQVWNEFTCSDKMYCPNPRCSQFIDLNVVRKDPNTHGSCTACGTLLCYGCRSSWHNGMTCEQFQSLSEEAKCDINDVGLIKLADEKGWRRCLKCRRMVELRYGCHHITCTCGHEFCYICGEQWPARGTRYKCKNGCRLWHNNRSSRSPGNSSQTSSRSNSSGSSGSDYKVLNAHSCGFVGRSLLLCEQSPEIYESSPSNSSRSRSSSPHIRLKSRSPSPNSDCGSVK